MRKSKEKTVQIPFDLFFNLVKYFLIFDDQDNPEMVLETRQRIRQSINNKLDAMMRHEAYTKYQTAETETEREIARIKYLEMIGMRESFRW